ncbi:MAG: class I SAM-dependent methyltransferase [Marivibrio sp.]|uniref:SAM-dependent methyltransferase n=1 Tax=Marivibrio sp. TaxID=2039719 RepID=UPI0032EC482C
MWNERYRAPGYLFGVEPALFLQRERGRLTPGLKALAIADGEGRNSVFMAEQGLAVDAFDASEVGLAKARALAAERGVEVAYHLAGIEEWPWTPEAYDLVVAIFIQFASPAERGPLFDRMKETLKPGGTLLLHGYRPKQIEYGTGGPPHAENMYDEALLRDAFGDLEIERLESYDREIDEGPGHSGMSALIDLVARKPG